MSTKKTLRFLLGDQLNYKHSWFAKKPDADVLYVMMEVKTESEYVCHHLQKIIGFFAAMRQFKEHFEQKGFEFLYLRLDDKNNKQDFKQNLDWIIKKYKIENFEMLEPDEYRLDLYFKEYINDLAIDAQVFDSEHFLTQRNDLQEFFGKKEKYLLESFYRRMRKKYNILLDKDKPLGGKWNFDLTNRKKYPKKIDIPAHKAFANDVTEILQMIEKQKINYIGRLADVKSFEYPITRKQALHVLDYFLKNLLRHFGDYQDAMSEKIIFGFHSRLSFALNLKILDPLEVIEKAQDYMHAHADRVDISQVEGFIRQILGWREFMRSFYWVKMPQFAKTNFFDNHRQLPKFFWDANTKMNCLKNCIENSLDNAYAHHIQRLMVTGNFLLLAGVHPDEVDLWYLGIYIDAIEWVEITNTRAMSQWADGGGLATKPYVSSANYINKMSDYCKNCFYNFQKKYNDDAQEDACPFNSLYWNFLDEHKDKLKNNMRMSMVYNVWNKIDAAEQAKILKQAKLYLDNLQNL